MNTFLKRTWRSYSCHSTSRVLRTLKKLRLNQKIRVAIIMIVKFATFVA